MQLFVHVITRLSDSPHLAKELTGTYWYGLFCFKLSKLLLNSNRKGPFKPTFSVKVTLQLASRLTAWNVFG